MYLIELDANTPIFERLQLEEALLRADDRSFCIVHFGSPKAIVMGISGNPDELIHLEKAKAEKVPIIRRFSGGGTVIVDHNTLFITFIMAKKDMDVEPFPEPILRWSADLYKEAWGIKDFSLRENDYCIGDRKCGGNAQYIRKDRWLHHTSFLYDYEKSNMELLKLPSKRPNYRLDRSHDDFLCKINHASRNEILETFYSTLAKKYVVQKFDLSSFVAKSHRQASHIL